METSKMLNMIGPLKVATLVFGIIDLGLTASTFLTKSSEQYFLAIVIIAFLLSLVFGIALLTGQIPVTDLWKQIDMIYHGSMALLLIVGIVAMTFSVFTHWSGWDWSIGTKVTRLFAVGFGALNACIYAYISYGIYKAPGV